MKKTYKIYQIDSFTKTLFKGNPAGVVTNADGLTNEQMQAIARELNNSETAFILSPKGNDHEVWIRFFTPTIEVPSCGHATIAEYVSKSCLFIFILSFLHYKLMFFFLFSLCCVR